jgi:hypothetical protein
VKLLRTLHEKELVSGHKMSLGLYEAPDGSHVYGVEEDGELVFAGTKAEAKRRYGNWRKE